MIEYGAKAAKWPMCGRTTADTPTHADAAIFLNHHILLEGGLFRTRKGINGISRLG